MFVHKQLVVNELMTRKIGLKSLNDPIDTTTPQGRLTFNLFASVAEYAEPAVMRSRELDPGQNTPGAPPCRRRQRLRLCPGSQPPKWKSNPSLADHDTTRIFQTAATILKIHFARGL